MLKHFAEQFETPLGEVSDALYNINKEVMRRKITDQGIRPDGRATTEVRQICAKRASCPAPRQRSVYPGQTQALTATTLEAFVKCRCWMVFNEDSKRYIHHTTSRPTPPEAGRMRSRQA